MKLENIIKKLNKEGTIVYKGEFDFKPCHMCKGIALIDLVDGEVADTSARYTDVLLQINNNKSHIYTVEGREKVLSAFNKLDY